LAWIGRYFLIMGIVPAGEPAGKSATRPTVDIHVTPADCPRASDDDGTVPWLLEGAKMRGTEK
jgi:hypothetical protein